MIFSNWAQILIFIILVILTAPLMGRYMAAVFQEKPIYFGSYLKKAELFFYQICQIDPKESMDWKGYLKALLTFNFFGFLFLFLLLISQQYLPLNPENLPNLRLDLALNTAMSFVTNTNWQAYSGETTLSYFSQMIGLTTQNFLSAATGICLMLVLIRGFLNRLSSHLGNFWVDLVKSVIYILLPFSLLLALVLVSQGVIQTVSPYQEITTLENQKQIIPLGPVASQVAIKQLGTNGGGFFGANSAHPFENPNLISNFLEHFAIHLLPAGLVFTFAFLIRDTKQGNMLFYLMIFFWVSTVLVACIFEMQPNPALQISKNLEGTETRLGVPNSFFWTMSTTSTGNGSVNSAIGSSTPMTSFLSLFNLMIGQVAFGGVGTGMCTMVKYIILSVFIAGLMVGRTPEYLGKKIEKNEILLVIVGILGPAILTLAGVGITCALPIAYTSTSQNGPHGFTEILYGFTSTVANNGSSFNGLISNTPYYNIFFSLLMLLGRLITVIPTLALAGGLSLKIYSPMSIGSISTNTFIFAILLSGVIIMATLSYLPSLILGPLFEQFLMIRGVVF